MITNL